MFDQMSKALTRMVAAFRAMARFLSEATHNDFTSQIDDGVALLDRKLGKGWVNQVEVRQLYLWSNFNCVLGQLAPYYRRISYSGMLRYLGISRGNPYGFYLPTSAVGPLGWIQLTRQWRVRIRTLQAERARILIRTDYDLAR